MKERKYGYIPSPKDLRDYKMKSKINKSIQLPTEFVVKHSHIKDQGLVGSCVAHAISEVLETNDNTNYSTGWIYGYRPFGYYQGEGMITSQALKTITKLGAVEEVDFSMNVEMNRAKEEVDSRLDLLKLKASDHKVKSYARLNSIYEIKCALFSSNKPVLIAIKVGENGLELDDKGIALIPDAYSGGHQLVCYGWNEDGLLIQNSWGESWGKNGTFILPITYPISEAWLIKFEGDKEDSTKIVKPRLFLLRKFIMWLIKLIKKINSKRR